MGIYGTWFVSTEAQVAGIWHIRRGCPGINPFTKEMVTVDRVIVDHGAIAKLPGLQVKFLIEKNVCALFGKDVLTERMTPPGCEEALCRIPDTSVRALVKRAPTSAILLSEWKENLAVLKPVSSYTDAFDETLAMDLYRLAIRAAESGGSLYGYVR
jgi:hypothetical protein